MSSHHIVKEKQEPALLVLSADKIETELFGQLLEWSPVLLANASIYEQLNSLGIKVDVLIGETSLPLQEHVINLDKRDSLIETGLDYLLAEDFPSVNVLTDTFEASMSQKYMEKMDIVFYCGSERIYTIKSGFSKWKPKAETFRILEQKAIQTENLTPLEKDILEVTEDGLISISFAGKPLLIAETL